MNMIDFVLTDWDKIENTQSMILVVCLHRKKEIR